MEWEKRYRTRFTSTPVTLVCGDELSFEFPLPLLLCFFSHPNIFQLKFLRPRRVSYIFLQTRRSHTRGYQFTQTLADATMSHVSTSTTVTSHVRSEKINCLIKSALDLSSIVEIIDVSVKGKLIISSNIDWALPARHWFLLLWLHHGCIAKLDTRQFFGQSIVYSFPVHKYNNRDSLAIWYEGKVLPCFKFFCFFF